MCHHVYYTVEIKLYTHNVYLLLLLFFFFRVKPLCRTNSLNHSKSGAMSKTESTLVRSGEVANKENKRMPMKKVSSASDLRTHHESQTRKRPHTRGYSGELPAKQNKPVARSNTCASRPPAKIMKITVPNTPSFMT